jgi:DNA-binding SARP family transcriptional activator
LAVLAANPQSAASAARLLDQIWDRDPDRQGMDLLKNAVYQLNRKFESELGVRPVSSKGSDYLIDRDAVVLDAAVFEDMVDRIDEYRSADPSLLYRWATEASGP